MAQQVLALVDGQIVEVEVAGAADVLTTLPYYVAADGAVALPEFSQTPVLMPTKLDGIIKNDGFIVEVR